MDTTRPALDLPLYTAARRVLQEKMQRITMISAVIAMLAETMIPEAFEKAPPFIGLITVIGFLAAYLLAQH